ncbi:GNAT family N-acetyltransferase [Nocardia iowensis]|uniref:GNAT family N-acetyltransferase n=1 Tax=Nocardia iowensis TaxID=204891 RepID=A0ABX8RXF2_NOCIO|nr:GNAT family N-acetyltransferase [Nocardia iowensis]QXN94345.1 GNAT family N-acetyltransferase [Nocardia iowensis]
MAIYLETDRLILRHFTENDAELLIELDSDPEVMRYLSGGVPTPPEKIHQETMPRLLSQYEKWDGAYGTFAAHEKTSGEFIGWFILRPKADGPLDEVELGYRFRKTAWGNGYATEGSTALLHKAFTELGVHMVWAETMFVNRASRNVMEKVGMTHVQTHFPEPPLIEGAEHGEVRYEITCHDWELSGPSRPAG